MQGDYHEAFWSALVGVAGTIFAGELVAAVVALRTYMVAFRGRGQMVTAYSGFVGLTVVSGWLAVNARTVWGAVQISGTAFFGWAALLLYERQRRREAGAVGQTPLSRQSKLLLGGQALLGSVAFCAQILVMYVCLESLASERDRWRPKVGVWSELGGLVAVPLVLLLTERAAASLKHDDEAAGAVAGVSEGSS